MMKGLKKQVGFFVPKSVWHVVAWLIFCMIVITAITGWMLSLN